MWEEWRPRILREFERAVSGEDFECFESGTQTTEGRHCIHAGSGIELKTGILGGTFDPIHKGHMAIAQRALQFFELDSVVLMVAHVSPHKQGQGIASSCHRFAMAVLETEGDPRLGVSDWELQRSGLSYTSLTLANWSATHPGTDLCFIAGSTRSWRSICGGTVLNS